MSIRELILKNRSYRRFYEEDKIERRLLEEWVDLARLSPSAKNLQYFKYHIACTEDLCRQIFPLTAWAGYLKDWDGPPEGERPVAYITLLHDNSISSNIGNEQGIAAQSILLGATEKGFGGCIIAAVKKKQLSELLELPPHLDIIYTIALGKPKEIVILEEAKDGNILYYRDKKQQHYVPKRPLKEVVVNWE